MKRHNLFRLAALPIIIFTFQSCFTAKKYVRPEVVNENHFRTDQLPQDSSVIAEVSWRDMFSDPLLVQYIEEGLDNNLDIRIAVQQIEAAEAYYKQGKTSFFPSLTANAQVQKNDGSDPQFTLSGTLSWEADIWGSIKSGLRASEASYLQTVAAHQAVKTELIAGISSLYYRVSSLDEQIEITKRSIQIRERSLQTTESLKNAGYITEAGVEQTKAQLYTAQSILIDLELNKKLLENTLSILLGRFPDEIEHSSFDEQQIVPDLSAGFPAELLSNRPDVIAAEYAFITAFELTNVARGNLYPTINLTATGGLTNSQLDELFSARSWFTNILGSLTQPLFFGRQLRTQYEVAQSQQEIAYLNFKRAMLTASREVSDALYSIASAQERIKVIELQVQSLESATRYSEELLNNGMVNYLEVLTARENMLNSQLNLISAHFELLNAKVDLYRALGGGWK